MSVKHIISTAVCLLSLVYPCVSSAAYVIKLRNGRKFVTSQYWQDDRHIRFYLHGGVVGIADSSVLAIQEYHAQHAEEVPLKEESVPVIPVVSVQIANVKNDPEDTKPIDFEIYKKMKDLLKSQIDSTLEKYRDASNNRKDEDKEKAQQDITELSKQLFVLTDDVKKKNNGNLPDGWDNF